MESGGRLDHRFHLDIISWAMQFARRNEADQHYWAGTMSRLRPYEFRARRAQMYHMKRFSLSPRRAGKRRFILIA